MNLISSPHEKRYRKGASLSLSEFLYLHRHIFSCVYCTVTGGDSLGTRTPPHSARGTSTGAPWDQWVLGYPSVWDGVGKGSGPSEARASPQSWWPGTEEPQSPSKLGCVILWSTSSVRSPLCRAQLRQGCKKSPGTALSRSTAPSAGFGTGQQMLAACLELDPEGPARGPC